MMAAINKIVSVDAVAAMSVPEFEEKVAVECLIEYLKITLLKAHSPSLSSMVTVAVAGVSMSPVDNMAVNISVSSAVESSMMFTFIVSSVCPGASASTLGVATKSSPAMDLIITITAISILQ